MTTDLGGYMGRVLRVDLGTRAVADYPWTDEDRLATFGGKAMAARILLDTLPADTDPLGPHNTVVISTGPLTGTGAPSTSRFNMSALSPLTGTVGSANCGGPFGVYLKKAGVDALVITGASDAPVWLEISDGGTVHFHDAGDVWGLGTGATQEALVDRAAASGGRSGAKVGTLVIGPAGENLVRYACVVSGERAAGRTGLGAVLGAKRLKGLVAHGEARVPIADENGFRSLVKSWSATLKTHPMTGDVLPKYGTGGFRPRRQEVGSVPTRNKRQTRFEGADAISGQALAERRLLRNGGCLSCPIRCERVVEHEGREIKGPELETLVLLGANIGNADLDAIVSWNALLDDLGLDTMTAGGTLAFAMELADRGLAPFPLEFGKIEGISELIGDIAYRRGIGDELAEGSRRLAQRYGAQEAAINVKGLELAAYDPRRAVGHGLGYATSNRGGCHLNGGYAVVLEGLGLRMSGTGQASKHALTAMFQDLMEAVSSTGTCLFTTYAVLPGPLIRSAAGSLGSVAAGVLTVSGPVLKGLRAISPGALGIAMPLIPHIRAVELVTGRTIGFGRFWAVGERGFTMERLLGRRFGLTAADDTLPGRLLTEPVDAGDARSVVPLEPMKRRYYAHRGWDAHGAPTARTLRRLRIRDSRER